MKNFKETTHLSEILEESNKSPVIIFKFSSECGSSDRLQKELDESVEKGDLKLPIYLVTVQKQKMLSKKIEEYFDIKHESPQILIIDDKKVTYHRNHFKIKVEEICDNMNK